MRILIATDAWKPQVNGVVRTLTTVVEHLKQDSHEVLVVRPDMFDTVRCPGYGEISVAWNTFGLSQTIDEFSPDHIHIATEGPIGWTARRYCRKRRYNFTTAYHTKFPEYLDNNFGIPTGMTAGVLKRFHRPACRTLVPNQSLVDEMLSKGYRDNLCVWGRGVDTQVFHPKHAKPAEFERPVFLNVGRVSKEKNLEAFIDLDLPGSKLIVGDGPYLKALSSCYSNESTHFLGNKAGQELSEIYASADVFVFPSTTDTFGLVNLEANASGLPVAAFDQPHMHEVINDGVSGILSDDLQEAALGCLALNPEYCRRHAQRRSWKEISKQFANYLVSIHAKSVHL